MEKNNLWDMVYYNESVRIKMSIDEKNLLIKTATKNHQSISRFVLEAIADKIKKAK